MGHRQRPTWDPVPRAADCRVPRRVAGVFLCALVAVSACAHSGSPGAAGPSRSAQRFAAEAAAVGRVAYEEDYFDARLIYQALPLDARPRSALRHKLLEYLVGPLARLELEGARKDPGLLGSNDEFDQVLGAFQDALGLYAPSELWVAGGLRLPPQEQAVVARAARTVVELFSPRGNEQAVATALFVLAALEPGQPAWQERLDQLFAWLEVGSGVSAGRGDQPSAGEVLDALSNTWPTPAVIARLTKLTLGRQERLADVLRRPHGTGTNRSALGDLLLDGEAMQALAVNIAALHLRCGQIPNAVAALERLSGRPGDDAALRALLAAAARSQPPPEAYLALARRFLPRLELLGGVSHDRIDPPAAAEVLRLGLIRHPTDVRLLVLASRVARFLPAPFLALRYLEEAQAVLDRSGSRSEMLGEVTAELLELSFSRLRLLIDDPRHIEPAARQAEVLRRRFATERRRFGDARFKLREADIDFALARGLVDAGLIERAEPLLMRAQKADASAEVTLHVAKLVLKRGDPSRAALVLRQGLETLERAAPAQETIGLVEGQSKLARALGDAHEVAGRRDEAHTAWKRAVRGWERLMVEHLRRKNFDASAEATYEVGRLYYVLGRRPEGLQKLNEAIEQNDSRGQTYIDALAFLVQNGETDAAQEIFRRVLARPTRAVSEYFKVYASLWILDLTRRSQGTADPTAEEYLRRLDGRKLHIRPRRDAAWYLPLARYALGRITYEALLPLADTPGKRAELYFYEAMRRLADGRRGDAQALWTKVIETNMFSFFEFDMAARYLRTGAPSAPRPEPPPGAETI